MGEPGCRRFICLVHLFVPAGSTWTLLSNIGPSARSGHAAAAGNSQVLWIFGGKDEVVLADIWLFSEAANAWSSSAVVDLFSATPAPRKEHVAVTDGNGDLWIHGGEDEQQFFNDLWKLSSNTWSLISNQSMSSRGSHVGVWDSINEALWIHGGYDGAFKQDMWKFNAVSGWLRVVDGSDGPSARAHHVAAMDALTGVIWVHGGYDGGLRGDLWKFDTETSSWSLVSTGGPSARAHHVGVWDPVNQALWLHGGFDGLAREDLWRFDTVTNIWIVATQSGPAARFDHVAAWDPTNSGILIHGGYDQGLHRDLWRFDVGLLTTTFTSTVTFTMTSQTSSSTTSSTTVTAVVSETEDEGLSSEVLALLLISILLVLMACCCATFWYRQRQKKREIVPVPPPPPPPPAPRSPQYRVNMQVLVSPPEPQEPLSVAFPSRALAPPEPCRVPPEPCRVPPICISGSCDAGLMPDQVDVEIVKLPALSGCKPRAPGRTEIPSHLPRCGHASPHHERGSAVRAHNSSPRLEVWTQSPCPVGATPSVNPGFSVPGSSGPTCQTCGKCKKVTRKPA